MSDDNYMKDIRVEKVVVNIGAGDAGEKLEKAKRMLGELTGKKILTTKTAKRTTFGTPGGRPIGCMVTLRGEDAVKFLKNVLDAVEFQIKKKSFDAQGNFSFGIKEHIGIPGVKYDPSIGIYGMDVCVCLSRKGYRVLRRGGKISKTHRVSPDEARDWTAKTFNVKVI